MSATPTERAVAIAAVRAAAELCVAVRARFDAHLRTDKADRSPVTVADLGAQVLVSRALAAAFPDDPLVGEEDAGSVADPAMLAEVVAAVHGREPGIDGAAGEGGPDRGGADGGAAGRWWTLDPVDGTKGYLRDEQYAVALALLVDGQPVLGVLGCPNLPRGDGNGTGVLVVAERGRGAVELALGDPDAPARPLRVAPVREARAARYAESVEAAHSAQDEAARIAERLGIDAPPLRMDSQAKYAVVARGDASIYLRIPHGDYRENVWDHAAGVLVVEEAGGRVRDVDGRTLDFTRGRRLTANRGIVAAPDAIADAVIDAVRAVLAEPAA
ncbi:MAG: inositol monophosphatase family protein [Chloroflexota bacterium]